MLSYIYFLIIALSIGVGFFRWKLLAPSWLKLFVVYLVLVLVIEISGHFLINFFHQRNGWLYNIYIWVYLFLLSFYLPGADPVIISGK